MPSKCNSIFFFSNPNIYYRAVIKVNQDPLGIQGTRLRNEQNIEVI